MAGLWFLAFILPKGQTVDVGEASVFSDELMKAKHRKREGTR